MSALIIMKRRPYRPASDTVKVATLVGTQVLPALKEAQADGPPSWL
jgi:hypothetical protein